MRSANAIAVAIASLGTASGAGESRKPDMDRINHVLHDVTDDVQYWIAYYYGPTGPTAPPSDQHMTATDLSEYTLILEPIYAWREHAWANAVLIESMPDAATRSAQDDTMQTYAGMVALGFQSPKLASPAPERVAYCEAHG